jgi:hypothetical protein
MSIVAVNGWLLNRLVQLDLPHPGLISHFYTSSNERRHVISAFLAVDRPSSDFRNPGEVAWLLRRGGHDVILAAAYGDVPPGLRGALTRTDTAVQPRRYYAYLRSLLASPDLSLRRFVERLPPITLEKLRVARALPADARRPDIVGRLTNLRHARDLALFLDLVAHHGADRTAMIAAFQGQKRSLRDVARHWSLKTSFPPHPIPESPAYKPINSGSELRDVAHRCRNCVRVYIADILDGVCTFAIFNREDREHAVVHLQRAGGEAWALQGLHGPSNLAVSRELREQAEAYLEQHGIVIRRRARARLKFDPVRRLTGHYAFDDDGD